MKAKEYFVSFNTENQDKSPEWRLTMALQQMINEVQEIAKMRNTSNDVAVRKIFLEQEIKSIAFIKLLNENNSFGENNEVANDAFKLLVKIRSEMLYNSVWG